MDATLAFQQAMAIVRIHGTTPRPLILRLLQALMRDVAVPGAGEK